MKNYRIYIGQLGLWGKEWYVQAHTEEEAFNKFIDSLSEQYKHCARTMGVKIYDEEELCNSLSLYPHL